MKQEYDKRNFLIYGTMLVIVGFIVGMVFSQLFLNTRVVEKTIEIPTIQTQTKTEKVYVGENPAWVSDVDEHDKRRFMDEIDRQWDDLKPWSPPCEYNDQACLDRWSGWK